MRGLATSTFTRWDFLYFRRSRREVEFPNEDKSNIICDKMGFGVLKSAGGWK